MYNIFTSFLDRAWVSLVLNTFTINCFPIFSCIRYLKFTLDKIRRKHILAAISPWKTTYNRDRITWIKSSFGFRCYLWNIGRYPMSCENLYIIDSFSLSSLFLLFIFFRFYCTQKRGSDFINTKSFIFRTTFTI